MKKTVIPTVLLLLILFLSISHAIIVSADVTGSNFTVYFAQNNNLVFQNNLIQNVSLTISSGTLNSSSNSIRIYSGGGYFVFNSSSNATITIDFTSVSCHVYGDLANGNLINDSRAISTGDSLTFIANRQGVISWTVHLEAWLPIMFIFGMIGLVSMFFGGLNFVHEIQKKHYYKGFIVSTIAIAIGISFVLAWLWT